MLGKSTLCGYDIGCGFSTTANRSAILGPKLQATEFKFCCGSFHGYAHNRICQLQWHPLYIPGAGLEDFETCERVFAESNKVAAVTRSASTFHRQQWLQRVFERLNNDKFGESSKYHSLMYLELCSSWCEYCLPSSRLTTHRPLIEPLCWHIWSFHPHLWWGGECSVPIKTRIDFGHDRLNGRPHTS